MVQFKILAGGFSTFIATYLFDSDANSLSINSQSETGTNPSWIVSNPNDKSILYATNENLPGDMQSLKVAEDGTITVVDTVSSAGDGPTFADVLSTGELTAMNFGSPTAAFIPLDPQDPSKFGADAIPVQFPRPQGSSNPHMSLEVNGEILIPDLGADKIWRVTKDSGEGFSLTGQIDIDAGAGPRHIAMQGDVLLTLHEKTSALTAQLIPDGPNGTTNALLANVSIVPANPPEGTKFAAAEIFVSPVSEKFPEPLIYCSNRNIGETIDPAGDTIAIFQLVGGSTGSTNGTASGTASSCKKRRHARHFPRQAEFSLELVAQVPTGLQQIRSMALGPVENGGDEFIVAGANTLGGVSVFRRVDGGRNLELVVNNQDLQNRTSFVFV